MKNNGQFIIIVVAACILIYMYFSLFLVTGKSKTGISFGFGVVGIYLN